MIDTSAQDRRARRNVFVLVAAQAILGSQITMIFTIGGLAGQQLAPNPCLATLPISLIVFGSMTTAPWLSALMQRVGRRVGFVTGAMGGLLGSVIAAYALVQANFWLFLVGSYLTGIYMSAQGFYRFAATDTASDAFKPKAISYVMAGGLVSALIGPQLVKVTADATVIPFLGTYLAALTINVLGMLLFLFLDIPKPPAPKADAPRGRNWRELLSTPEIAVAVICAMVSYALMNLVMTSTPLAVVGCGFDTGNASDIVSAHVLAMFAPSFFTGHLIARFGAERIVAIGLFILALAGGVALQGVHLENFFIALILLGIGWNFGFIGATTMLARAHTPEERGRVQGMNDALVFGCGTLASLASGGLMNCSGGSPVEGWNAVNLAMAPFLALAGGALIWLMMHRRTWARG
jgi:MFS family permease